MHIIVHLNVDKYIFDKQCVCVYILYIYTCMQQENGISHKIVLLNIFIHNNIKLLSINLTHLYSLYCIIDTLNYITLQIKKIQYLMPEGINIIKLISHKVLKIMLLH